MTHALNYSEHEVFSQLRVPPDLPFFVRLDGRRFRAVSEEAGAEKPFDKRFARCLVVSAKAIFRSGFNPALIFTVSDELNLLFLHSAPFRRRVEKIDSVLASIASSAFSLAAFETFGKVLVISFDSRVVISHQEKIADYLVWRQMDAWRNHNNAYGYWFLRKMGRKPREAAKILKGMKAGDIHDMLFRHGINLAQTPAWQRRGILIYREPYQKWVKDRAIIRRRIKENWNLPLFSSEEGQNLVQRILEWTRT